MPGKPKHCQPKLFYHDISLEERVPPEHPLRLIKQIVDFGFARSQVAHLYGHKGHASIDPAVVLKLMFLSFYENVRSERQLLAQLPLRLDWLWFCDYDLDETTPHHSIMSKARKRWGPDVFEQFFLNILGQCYEAGLIDGQTIHVDSSMIDGNADIDKMQPQFRQLCQALVKKLDDGDAPGEENSDDSGDENPPGNQRLNKKVNPVDPDARLGKKPGEAVLGYKDHRAVDDRYGIITSTHTTAANIDDSRMLSQVMDGHEANTSCRAEMIVADTIYGNAANYQKIRRQGKRCCIPRQRYGTRANSDFSHDKFTYDAQRDCYVCPAGERLELYTYQGPASGDYRYLADRATCQKCPSMGDCVTSKKHGRQITRSGKTEVMEWADTCCSPGQRHRLQGRRRSKAEGSFADAANNHGFKRARWRGLKNMTIQNLMIAAVQNLRKLIRYGRFHPAEGIGNCLFQAYRNLDGLFLRLQNQFLTLKTAGEKF